MYLFQFCRILSTEPCSLILPRRFMGCTHKIHPWVVKFNPASEGTAVLVWAWSTCHQLVTSPQHGPGDPGAAQYILCLTLAMGQATPSLAGLGVCPGWEWNLLKRPDCPRSALRAHAWQSSPSSWRILWKNTWTETHDRLRKGPCARPEFYMKAFETQTHKVKENDIDVKRKFKAKEK